MIKLSIIIPYYNTKDYTDELLGVLNRQITEEVQVILVYDVGTEPYISNYSWLEIYQQDSRGLSRARNYGIECAKGEYIAFIDSDDLVSENYITQVINAIKTQKFDQCHISWKTLENPPKLDVKLNCKTDRLPNWNWACWSRIYRRDIVKDIKFPDGWDEDVPFVKAANAKSNYITVITDYIYFYRCELENSRTQRHSRGESEWDI